MKSQTLKDRLEELMEAMSWEYADLVRESGQSRSVVSQWLGRGSKAIHSIGKMEAAERLEHATGYCALWIAKGVGPKLIASQHRSAGPALPIKLEENPIYPAIRRVRFKLSAGASGFAVEYLDEEDAPIVFRREWFTSHGYQPTKLFAVKVANGSMEPGLWDGDTVVVNTADTEPQDGHVFAVNFEGELVIKRLVRDEGRWWLKSDNPDQSRYPRKACGEGVHIIGRIVHKQSEHI